jgi:hypothetical protein
MNSLELGHLVGSKKPVRLKMPADEGYQLTVIGASGSGKTHTLYRIIEHIPKDRPIFIADPEQDFIPLRRHRDFVIVGKGRDLPADPTLAPMLAKRFLEMGFSIIFDAFEEKKRDRELFLKGFLETLHDAPRSMWRSASLLLDELDTWAPEKGSGESLCTEACANAAKRFRKRGFDLIMATQRPAEVDKTVISQSRNLLIGLANIDTDIKRSLSFLGFTEKEDRAAYRDLQRGEWFARGPELGLRHPEKMVVGEAKLFDRKAKKGTIARAPAPHGQVKKLLGELKDLPKQAAEEIRDLDQLRARVRELEREQKKKPEPAAPEAIQAARVEGYAKGRSEIMKQMGPLKNKLEKHLKEISVLVSQIPEDGGAAPTIDPKRVEKWKANALPVPSAAPLRAHAPRPQEVENGERTYGACERKILGFLLAKPGTEFTPQQVATMTGYANSGGFRNALANLSQGGLIIRHNGMITIDMDSEARALGLADRVAHRLEDWIAKLSKCEREVYKLLLDAPDKTWTKDEISEVVGYANSGGFRNALSRLNTLGLIKRHRGGKIGLNPEVASL